MNNILKAINAAGEPHMANAEIDIDKLIPLADMVLVERLPDAERSFGGLWLPETSRDKREGLRIGKVLAVGRGDRLRFKYEPPEGLGIKVEGELWWETRIPMNVRVGDRIIYVRVPDNDVRINGRDMVILREEQHVLAVLEDGI